MRMPSLASNKIGHLRISHQQLILKNDLNAVENLIFRASVEQQVQCTT